MRKYAKIFLYSTREFSNYRNRSGITTGEKMKKKLVISIIAVFMLVFSVVSAASLYGEYDGYPILKLIDGKTGKEITSEDVPPFVYNGRTLVPISLLTKIGMQVQYDAPTKKIFVTAPTTKAVNQPTTSSSDSIDLDRIKFISKTSDHYQKLMSLGDVIAGLSDSYSLTFNAINTGMSNANSRLTTSYDNLSSVVDAYNAILDSTSAIVSTGSSYGYNLSDMNTIIKNYYDAIEYYKTSITSLDFYYTSLLNADFDSYLKNSSNGFDETHSGRISALSGYNKYYNLLQNY